MTNPAWPTVWNGNGSGKTYAGRWKVAPIAARIANATAEVAATQPIVEPRRRYGWTSPT